MRHQHIINHVVFAKQRRVFENHILTVEESISNYVVKGNYDIICSFVFSEEGRNTCIDYTFKGEITLECQTDLSDLPHTIDLDGSVILVKDDRQAQNSTRAPYNCTTQDLDLVDILKEEIILSIPLVPKKDTNTCKKQKKPSYYGELENVIEEKKNPFDILKSLK
jgi:uncharacterized protein